MKLYTNKMRYKGSTPVLGASSGLINKAIVGGIVMCDYDVSYNVTLSTNDDSMGSVTGSGNYKPGVQVTISAAPFTGYLFVGWYDDNDTLVTTQSSYSFLINEDINYEARFEAETQYTEVSCLKSTSTSYNYCYFDTGVNTSLFANKIAVIHIKYTPLVNNGNIYFGHCGSGYITLSDTRDCRLFYYSSSMYCDVGNGRRSTADSFNIQHNIKWTIDSVTLKYKVENESGGTILSETSMSWAPNNYNIFINIGPMKFNSMKIEVDNVVIRDLITVLDKDNTPCLYDKINDTYIYVTDGQSYLTYEQ